MQYVEYGKTGKKVSRLGLGGMRFDPEKEKLAEEVIHKAIHLGINYIDTAPGYCKDQSETFIGNALASLSEIHENPIFISTKSSIHDDKTADDVRHRIDDQLKKLKINTITFYNMWCIMDIEHFNAVMAPGGPYEGAAKARQEGLIEHIVCSTHAPGRDIAAIVKSDVFEGYTLGYNILNYTYREEGLKAIASSERAVIAMNPLGGGLLTRDKERLSILKENDSESFIAAALKFTLHKPEITIVLPGMKTVGEVEANVQTSESITNPDPEMVTGIINRFESLGESFCTSCRYCLECCPESIQIHLYASLWDRVRLKLPDEARRVYSIFIHNDDQWLKGKRAIDCTECGECEKFCTQKLPIREFLRNCAAFFSE